MIVPNCRQHITSADLAFALDAVSPGASRAPELRDASTDVDELLDSRELFEALVRSGSLLSVSPYFFYYVLVRQVFRERGIGEREVADYVAALLAHFLEGRRLREGGGVATPRAFVYLVDLVKAAREARDGRAAFAMEARIGDVALFLTGVFPDAIHHRHTYGRRATGLDYYEAVGRSGYRSASQHPPAGHADLAPVLGYLAAEFRGLRHALNELSDRWFWSGPEPVERLIRQALHNGDPSADAGPHGGRDESDGPDPDDWLVSDV
ncbi:MAG TPA: hypothetical protein VIC56_02490 [Gemmatimonadota bacterium]